MGFYAQWHSSIVEIRKATSSSPFVCRGRNYRPFSLGSGGHICAPRRRLLEKLGFPQLDPTCIYEDNQTCIAWSEGSVCGTDRAKHIDLREHFVHDAVEAKTLKLMPIATMDNVADLLTKPPPKAAFLTLRKRLMGL